MTCHGPTGSVLVYLRGNVRVLELLYKTRYVLGKHFRAVIWRFKEAYLPRPAFWSFLHPNRSNRIKNQKGDLKTKWELPYFQIFRFFSPVNSSNNFLPLLISNITGHCVWNLPLLAVLPSTMMIPLQVIITLMLSYLTLIKYPSLLLCVFSLEVLYSTRFESMRLENTLFLFIKHNLFFGNLYKIQLLAWLFS